MKFFWKIYFSFTILFLVSSGLFGTWLIHLAFQKSYQQALEEGERENRMYQLAFEMNLNVLNEVYQTEAFIPVTADMVAQNLGAQGGVFRVFSQSGELLYESLPLACQSRILEKLTEEQPCGYEILREQGSTWLSFACRSAAGKEIYYLESLKDISRIYEDREYYYDWYTLLMLGLALAIPAIVYFITRLLTGSIQELSHITRRFTEGDYQVRASQEGGDEIAALARDFNHMADTITEKMEELTMHARRQEDFTASFAHELKTPLTSIIGYADMLRSMECTPQERMEAANYILQQGKRLESLSFKLLELIVADKQEYDFRLLPVRKLVGEAVRLTEVKRREKNVFLLLELEDGQILGEKDLLISVFVNLLDNARKAVKEEGRILLRGRSFQGGYLLSISDDGCGMEKEEVSRITEAFYMVDKSRARKEGGAGLGMTLCSRILKLHEARWEILSIPGKGTSIAISFKGKEKGE